MYPWGWGELEGIANRTDFDLTQHSKFSGQDLTYFDQEHDRRYLPYVIEPAAGADRATLAFLLAAYEEEDVDNGKGGTEKRTVLRLHPRLAPIKVAVLPLSKNEQLVPVADEVAALLRPELMIDVDVAGSIGRRYRRQDEVGTPLCVTVDFDTLDDRAVTIRDRDTMAQDRVPIDGLLAQLRRTLPSMTTTTTTRSSGSSRAHRATRSATRTAGGSPTSRPHARRRASPNRSCRRTATRSRASAPRGTCCPTRSSASATTRSSTPPADGDVELVDDDDAGPRAGTEQRADGLAEAARAAAAEGGRAAAPRTATASKAAQPTTAGATGPSRRSSLPEGMAARRAARSGAWRCCSTSPSSCVIFIGVSFLRARGDPERLLRHRQDQIDKVGTLPRASRTTSTTPRPLDKDEGRGPDGASTTARDRT